MHRFVVVALAVWVVMALVVPVAAGAGTGRGSAAAGAGAITWTACGSQLECANVPVPLDWAHPNLNHLVDRLKAVSRIGGPVVGWLAGAPCASWPTPSANRYTGPWNTATKHPILVIGTRFDPTTPLRNAQLAARRLGNAVLLVHDGYGHTSHRDPSTCVIQATSRYLVNLTTPPSGTVCPSDRLPFDPDFGQLIP